MKITSRSTIFSFLLAASAVIASSQAVPAQEAVPADARIFVDLRDASLYDALDLVFRAAGVTSYKIDDQARSATIGTASFTNRRWDDVVRVLANDNGFRLRNLGGTYTIDRRPTATNNGFSNPMGGFPGATPGGFSGVMPPGMIPPGGNPSGNIMTFGGRKMSLETRPSPQILPGGRQDNQGGGAPASTEFRLRLIQHVYAGGIVRLFENASVLTTREFIVPSSALDTLGSGGSQSGSSGGFGDSSGGGGGGGGFGGGGGGIGGGTGGGGGGIGGGGIGGFGFSY